MSEYLKKYTEYLIDRIVIQIKIIHPKGACKNCLQFFESKATVADDLLFIGSPKSLKPKAKKRLNERYTETLKELDQILNLLTSIQDTIFQGISAIQESWNQIYGQSFGSKLLWEKLISDLSPIIDEKSKTANLQSVIQESSETPLTKISQIRSEVSELQRLNNLAQEMYSKKNFIESLQTLLNMKLLIKNLQEITQCVYNTLKQRLTNELQPTLKTFDIGTHTRRALETALYRTSSFLSSSSNDSDDFSSDSDTETQSFNTLSSSSASSSNPSTPKLSNDCTELELSTHSDFTPNPFSDSSDTESDDDIETFILPDAINSPQDNSDIVTPNPEITLPYKPIFSDSSPLHATSTPTFSVSTPKYPNINVYAMISTHSSASSSSENKTVLYKYFRDLQGMASDAAQESAPISANIPFGGYIE